MNVDDLASYFDAIAVKRLSAVEVDPQTSNQHEFNGSDALKSVLGTGNGERVALPVRFIRVGDTKVETVTSQFLDAGLSWYDARRNHPTRSEYRLYYPAGLLSSRASAGDSLFLVRRAGGELLMIVAAADSTEEQQLLWLFGQTTPGEQQGFTGGSVEPGRTLPSAIYTVLDELGVERVEREGELLDGLLERFGDTLPSTRTFSAFARETLSDVRAEDDPDAALLAWLDREERLFRRFERRGIEDRVREGFEVDGEMDVDGFLAYSLGVQNRRKSRAGQSFEHHISAVLDAHGVRHARGAVTENRSKPDFLFPGIEEYRDPAYPSTLLTMLGAKTTCKDRWRQVLTEAKRIDGKHLLTIEPGISEAQTREMQHHGLQLVVPAELHDSYRDTQRDWLFDVRCLIELILRREGKPARHEAGNR